MLLFGNFMSFVLLQLLLHSTILLVSSETSPYLASKYCPEKQGLVGDNPQIRMYGRCVNYISSTEECRQEIERLKLRFTNKDDFQDDKRVALGVEAQSSDRPQACYGYNGTFYFNTDSTSPQSCGYDGRMCVCQEPMCEPCPKESYSFGGWNIRCTPCPRETDEIRKYPRIVEQCQEFWDDPYVDL